ncbi:MAG: universal stress protein, partial [Desulfobacterales bacterium]|nr:universal stress protein [Desulfobacterales bacterium]
MDTTLFHIFRNTPLGRETLLQSIFFCRKMEASPVVYIPKHTKFLMYYDNDVVQVDLDASYLTHPDSASKHAADLLTEGGLKPRFLEPKHFTASTLPDISTNFDFMCCPRSISDMHSKIGLGYIGPRVRRIVQSARFPVLITSPAFKKWRNIMVFFGGSSNAVNALKLGFRMARATGMPLKVFTQVEKGGRENYEKVIAKHGLEKEMERCTAEWLLFEKGKFEENLYEVPHDALVVLGAF